MPSVNICRAARYLHWVANRIQNPALRATCAFVLDDEAKFWGSVGSAEKHHAFPGGLAIHTAEVTAIAMGMVEQMGANADVVATAAIWHDFHKIYEYTVAEGIITKNEYRKLIRHVAGSHAEFVMRTAYYPERMLPLELRHQVEHAMLAHHGRFEWGSPTEPITKEAHILHFADMLSSRFGVKTVEEVNSMIPSVPVDVLPGQERWYHLNIT